MEASSSAHWNTRLRQERIQRNWRQQDLADHLGTTVVTVKRWERGSQQPSAYFRVKLCTLFGKSAEELFEELMSRGQKTSLLPPPQISQPDSNLKSETLAHTSTDIKSTVLETALQKTSAPAPSPGSAPAKASSNVVLPSWQRHHFSKRSLVLIRGTLVLLSLLVILATAFKLTIFVPAGSRSSPRDVQGQTQKLKTYMDTVK